MSQLKPGRRPFGYMAAMACKTTNLPGAGPVLVVEDDEAVGKSFKFALELEDMDVRLYKCASDLLQEKGLPPSGCLIVDYYMPGMNGIELLDSLRHQAVALPAILITAKVTDEIRRSAARSGFREVIEKPCYDGRLTEGIRQALTR